MKRYPKLEGLGYLLIGMQHYYHLLSAYIVTEQVEELNIAFVLRSP